MVVVCFIEREREGWVMEIMAVFDWEVHLRLAVEIQPKLRH